MPRYRAISQKDRLFADGLRTLLDDHVEAAHVLLPVIKKCSDAFFTFGNAENLQRLWAKENGIPNAPLDEIIRAQIEDHGAEIFYDMAPGLRQKGFARSLPGTVKKRIAWSVTPTTSEQLTEFDLVLGNFSSSLQQYANSGCAVAYF